MNYNESELRGRRLLLLLLGLNLLVRALSYGNAFRVLGSLPGQTAALAGLSLAAGLLPTAVVLWAIYRGSWPGLALLCISVVTGVINMVGLFQFGGAAAINHNTLMALMLLLSRGILLAAIFQHYEVSSWWNLQRLRRKNWYLVLEIVLYVLAQALHLWLGYWL